MIQLSEERLQAIIDGFDGKRILVLGDMMIDCYLMGDVKRISPEAPVPVVAVNEEFHRFGGAANVALNIKTLGGIALPTGVIGYDSYGSIFKSLITESDIDDDGLIIDEERPTTAKTRVIARNQHVVRVDKESTDYLSEETEKRLLDYIEKEIAALDGIILEDYNKGVLSASVIKAVIELAKKHNVLITVDPKFTNFFEYRGVTVFKPNKKEASDVLGFPIKTDADITKAGRSLLEKLEAQYVLLTLGEGGIAVFEQDGTERRMPTKARKVLDVSGAGDTVISTLTMALAAGADIFEACYLANYAAGIVIGEVGILPIEKETLYNTVKMVTK